MFLGKQTLDQGRCQTSKQELWQRKRILSKWDRKETFPACLEDLIFRKRRGCLFRTKEEQTLSKNGKIGHSEQEASVFD